jgi:hypothetical protein
VAAFLLVVTITVLASLIVTLLVVTLTGLISLIATVVVVVKAATRGLLRKRREMRWWMRASQPLAAQKSWRTTAWS